MDNKKDDLYYLTKICTDLQFIIGHTQHLTWESFTADEVLLDSVMFRLIQVSENSARLTEDFRTQHGSIPWTAIRGLRNRIVHEYGEVDHRIVFDTVMRDIPILLLQLSACGNEKLCD